MKDPEDIQRLISLKKYETPGDEYFQTFMENFKDRQRGELLHRSARGLLYERVTMWFDEIQGPRWLVPVGATAAAAIAFGLYTTRPEGPESGAALSGIASIASIAENSSPPSAAMAASSGTEEVITLQLPRPNQRVPGWEIAPSARQGAQPASASATFREL